ncbi:MAG: XisI protein [Leptolyngbya foveolarum]|uniref:XisI protein n=1 Tax=Leptolyngbya foveolarum TaxID=47253 RepID=A0A2W4TMD1_9CYAN|nr:MAG: XisI protein [Leptolyngbya foveolarum]
MEKLASYRQQIKTVLERKASIVPANASIETQLVFDTERDHYQIVHTGWKNNVDRLYGCVVHVDIKDGKIWIQHDGSELAIADQLVEMGVPQQDIVLAYHAPHVRQYTEFAVD